MRKPNEIWKFHLTPIRSPTETDKQISPNSNPTSAWKLHLMKSRNNIRTQEEIFHWIATWMRHKNSNWRQPKLGPNSIKNSTDPQLDSNVKILPSIKQKSDPNIIKYIPSNRNQNRKCLNNMLTQNTILKLQISSLRQFQALPPTTRKSYIEEKPY